MRSNNNITRWFNSFGLGLIVLIGMFVLGAQSASAAPNNNVNVGANLDQWQNGGTHDTTSVWKNGDLNFTNSHYKEGDTVPYRFLLGPLGGGTTPINYSLTFQYQTSKSGKHTMDYMGSYNASDDPAGNICTAINGESSFAPLCGAGPSAYPIPLDPNVTVPQQAGYFQIYNATIYKVVRPTDDCSTTNTAAPGYTPYVMDGAFGSSFTNTSIKICFTVNNPTPATVFLALGGHLAVGTGQWGVGLGASSVNGSPYHRSLDLEQNSSVLARGNRDLQVQVGAPVITPVGAITIDKECQPSSESASFSFTDDVTAHDSFPLGCGATKTFSNLSPSIYTFTEGTPSAGWEFDAYAPVISCVDTTNLSTPVTTTLSSAFGIAVTVTNTDSILCTFANQQTGTITIVKNTLGGDNICHVNITTDCFNFTVAGGPASISTPAAIETQNGTSSTSFGVDAGTYSVSEAEPSDGKWAFDSASCKNADLSSNGILIPTTVSTPAGPVVVGATISGINVTPGATVTCTFTNGKLGYMPVTKALNGHSTAGDTSNLWQFNLYNPSTSYSFGGSPFATANLGFFDPLLPPSTSPVAFCEIGKTNSIVEGFFSPTPASALPGGLIGLQPGWQEVFTVKYTPFGGPLQTTTNAGPGTLGPFYSGTNGIFCIDVSIANYGDILEIGVNNISPGHIKIVKSAVGGNGQFGFTVDGSSATASSSDSAGTLLAPVVVSNSGATTIDTLLGSSFTFDVTAGSGYAVNESSFPAGWDFTSASCVGTGTPSGQGVTGIMVNPDQTIVCTITNTKRGHLVVSKTTNPASQTDTFSVTASGGTITGVNGVPNTNGTQNFATNAPVDFEVKPGTAFAISEATLAGWDFTTASCDNGTLSTTGVTGITVGAGLTVNCSITNTKRGHIIVNKVVVPGTDPASFSFTTTGSTAGSTYADFSLSLGTTLSNDSGAIKAGPYSVKETSAPLLGVSWDLTGLSCGTTSTTGSGASVSAGVISTATGTIALGAGDTVTCTFTNTKRPMLTVRKLVNPNTDTGSFTFTIDTHISDVATGPFPANGYFYPVSGGFPVDPKTPHAVSENGALNTLLSDYSSSINCNSGAKATGTGVIWSVDFSKVDPGSNVVCTITNTVIKKWMTGGGSFVAANAQGPVNVTHGFELHCSTKESPNNLEVNWGGNSFHLTSLTTVSCTSNGSPNPPAANFNTLTGQGTGTLNGGKATAQIEFTLTDNGEPGTGDQVSMKISNGSGTLFDTNGITNLTGGNQQAHSPK